MELSVDNLEQQIKTTDEKLDNLALKVETVEREMFADDADNLEVFKLLKSVTEVKNDYQNLRKEIMEVQQLSNQLTCSLKDQLQFVQGRFSQLKSKILLNTAAQQPVKD